MPRDFVLRAIMLVWLALDFPQGCYTTLPINGLCISGERNSNLGLVYYG